MEIIKQNPFRILGLSLIASPREITRKIQELSTFAEFGKIVKYPTDFDFISPINRSLENIEEASRNIELAGNKLYHSLFWFWSDNSVDELVFDLLNDGDIHKAIILWNKAIDGNVTDKTYSNAAEALVFKFPRPANCFLRSRTFSSNFSIFCFNSAM